MGDHRSRRRLRAEKITAAMGAKHVRSGKREFRGEETRIVPDDQCGGFLLREDVAGDGGRRSSHARKRKILGDHSAPAGGSEMDRLARHGRYCILARKLKSRESPSASRKSKGVAMTDKIVVLVTCESVRQARKIARALVGRRLAACVQCRCPGGFDLPVEGKSRVGEESSCCCSRRARSDSRRSRCRAPAAQLRRAGNHRSADRSGFARLSGLDCSAR